MSPKKGALFGSKGIGRLKGATRKRPVVPGSPTLPLVLVRDDPAESVLRCQRAARRARLLLALIVALTLMLAMCLWTAAGLGMRAGMLPYFDIGYGWFDEHLFVLFGL